MRAANSLRRETKVGKRSWCAVCRVQIVPTSTSTGRLARKALAQSSMQAIQVWKGEDGEAASCRAGLVSTSLPSARRVFDELPHERSFEGGGW